MTRPLALTMGEPAGIGPDLLLALYAQREARGLPPFVVFGHGGFLKARAQRLGLDIAIATVDADNALDVFAQALPVVSIDGTVEDTPGAPDQHAAPVVINAITQAVEATMTGHCRAVVTAPIHKGALYHAGFKHPGHTEFLAELCAMGGTPKLPVMMLAHDDLRTVPLTIHVPIKDVPGLINRKLILETLKVMSHDLRQRFHIAAPRIAVAGLNPHAGEGGTIGREDVEIIGPAIADAQAEGIDAIGPLPGDTLFYPPHWRQYDAVLAMYHDQALIPIKTVAFDAGVNITLGLPIVRTSPDHGTAFDLAGTGKASPSSFAAAIAMADQMTAPKP
ncbi:4-hydroxythreonine-4-phosphate dehydrogenase PdxA [Devosia sp. XJ19-1]|uniref:4-hydroxythreonine-4-phosphate dehydrogenase n=1 Tax=Devosia ureilytica TaxID=2952754 RepID=A0A9Q4AKH9_9HYPH|nr:4-hydroxythreonine-4-phosphate dehydrogenase PdxA [Devosia ureilytica]MCP8882576.1 4-hydroxythreonine-4-phosphate dehydrogenase PdxA [Devosia ureilytica]MCP8885537.1 4-hydroxythreonine-4-phosphate dehydrogenase PdxA [Devosia ureilytica]